MKIYTDGKNANSENAIVITNFHLRTIQLPTSYSNFISYCYVAQLYNRYIIIIWVRDSPKVDILHEALVTSTSSSIYFSSSGLTAIFLRKCGSS